MKKNLFFGLFATMMLLLTTACQKENDLLGNGEATISFEISTPQMATRAFSDGTTATQLQYAVYDEQGNPIQRLSSNEAKFEPVTIEDFNGKRTINIPLATGKQYNVLFWAASSESPYEVDFEDKVLTVNYDETVCNSDHNDAFYSYIPVDVDGTKSQPVALKRPFAQLNIGTNDLGVKNEVDVTKTGVKVKGIYRTFNFATKKLGGNINKERTFALADRPVGETFKVDGYEYLAMAYVLVGNDQNYITDVTLCYGASDKTAKTREFTNIPVRGNHRTNLYGALLTSNVGFDVEIEEDFDGEVESTKAEELIVAAQTGGTYTLTEDVVLTKTLHVTSDFELNLNGKTITGPAAAVDADGNRIHVIVNDGRLIVRGGTIKSVAENGGSAIMNNGILTLNDATIVGAPTNTATGTASYALNNAGVGSKLIVNNCSITGRGAVGATNGTKVEINGGTYHIPAVAWGHAVYANGEGTEVVINAGTFSEGYAYAADIWGMYQIYAGDKAKVIVNGGDFSQEWDCANGYDLCTGTEGMIEIYGGTFAENPSAQNGKNYVAAGYAAIEKDGKWTVVATANNAETLAAAIAKGGVIVLTEDITATEVFTIRDGKTVVLDLNGKNVTAATSSAFEVRSGAELTIKNGKVTAYESTVRAIGGKAIIESGEYTSTGTAVDNPATLRYSLDSREGGELIINGGTFKSNNGLINVGSTVTINGGKFENIVEKTMTRHFAYVSGDLTINDGEFYGKANASAGGCFFCGAAAGCEILINGGKFTSLWTSGSANRIFEAYSSGTAINVTGGLFNANGGIASYVVENTDPATKDAYPYTAN